MVKLLAYLYFIIIVFRLYRESFLLNITNYVKICFISFATLAIAEANFDNEITLSKGQVYEMTGASVESYVIGNKDVINIKYNSKRKKLMINAKMLGFSELKIGTGNAFKTIKIFVLSKNRYLKLLEMKQRIEQIGGIETQIKAGSIFIKGKIDDEDDYRALNTSIEEYKFAIPSELAISKRLKNQIISNIYNEFFDQYLDEISCSFKGIKLLCHTTSTTFKHKELINRVESKYHAKVVVAPFKWNRENLELEIRFFQIERLDGEEVDLGLGEISLSLENILNSKFSSLKKNLVNIKDRKYDISTLSKPKAKISLDTPLEISVGTEIPYKSTNTTLGTSNISWKFAGIKLRATVKKYGDKYKIKYKNNISRPIQSLNDNPQISGTAQSSSVQLVINEPIELFEISLQTEDISETSIPLLNQIPILANIFKSKSKTKTYKKIMAIAMLRMR